MASGHLCRPASLVRCESYPRISDQKGAHHGGNRTLAPRLWTVEPGLTLVAERLRPSHESLHELTRGRKSCFVRTGAGIHLKLFNRLDECDVKTGDICFLELGGSLD